MPRNAKSLPERTITSWNQLRDVLEKLADAGWAFRGQADANWPLESSLTRYLKTYAGDPTGWLARESKILRTFQRKAHLLVPRTPDADEVLDWLALMQHHGAPTRLIDFTWSPYVAAFFALEKATTDAAIWAISSGPAIPNYRGFYISEMLSQILGFNHPQAPTRDDQRKFEPPTILGSSSLRDATSEQFPLAVLGEPVLMNQRMTAQAGTFVIPTIRIDVPVQSLIPKDRVVKLRLVTESLRRQTMERLYNMNINNATLFPGIDGLARSLAFELEFEWSVDAQAGQRLTRR